MKRGIYHGAAPGVLLAAALIALIGYCRWTGQFPGTVLDLLIGRIRLTVGFRIELYATHVPNARAMALGNGGIVFVGSRRAGKVYALLPDHDMRRAESMVTIERG
jgi:hypothetical protein